MSVSIEKVTGNRKKKYWESFKKPTPNWWYLIGNSEAK